MRPIARVVAAIEHQAEHFDMLGLQLGYRYADGAVLVRPDQHVGWRARSMPDDPRAVVGDALRSIVGV